MLFPILPDPRYFNPVETSRGFPMAIDAPLYGPRKYSLFQSRTGSAGWVPYALIGPGGRVTVDERGRVVLAHRVVLPILSAMRQIGGAFGGSGTKYQYIPRFGSPLKNGFTFLSEGLVYMPLITITRTESTGVIFTNVDQAPMYDSFVLLNDNITPGERRRVWSSESTPQTYSSGGSYRLYEAEIRTLAQKLYDNAVVVADLPKPVELVPPSAIPGAMDSADEHLFFPYADEPFFWAVDRDKYPSATSNFFRTGASYYERKAGTATLNQEPGPKSTYLWTIDTDLTSAHDERAIFSHFGINGTPGSVYRYRFKGAVTLTGANGEPLRVQAAKLMLRLYRVKADAHNRAYITDDPADAETAAKWPPLELLQTMELATIASPVDGAEALAVPINAGLSFELEACRLYVFELYFDGVDPLIVDSEEITPMESVYGPAFAHITRESVAAISYSGSDDILEPIQEE